MDKKKVILTYKKDTNILNNCRLNLTKNLINALSLSPEKKEIDFIYKNGIIYLSPFKEMKQEEKQENGDNLSYLKTIIKAIYEQKKNSYKLSIPLPVAKAMNLEKEKEVDIEILDNNTVRIKKSNESNELKEKNSKENIRLNKKLPEKNGKIYMVTIKKGGSAKTLTAIQLAYINSVILKRKTLLLSSDTSNDHLFNLLTLDEAEELSKGNIYRDDTGKICIKKGLKKLVLEDKEDLENIETKILEDYIVEARENLDVIPLEKDIFKLTTDKEYKEYKKYMLKFPKVMEKLRKIYDIIIIDGIPVSDIDHFYTEVTDKFIIPIVPDEPTIRGAINLVQSVGANRIHAIIISKYRKTAAKDEYLEILNNWIQGTKIIYPEPVKELAQIEQLIKNKKTIFETKSKYLLEAQKSFIKVAVTM